MYGPRGRKFFKSSSRHFANFHLFYFPLLFNNSDITQGYQTSA